MLSRRKKEFENLPVWRKQSIEFKMIKEEKNQEEKDESSKSDESHYDIYSETNEEIN